LEISQREERDTECDEEVDNKEGVKNIEYEE